MAQNFNSFTPRGNQNQPTNLGLAKGKERKEGAIESFPSDVDIPAEPDRRPPGHRGARAELRDQPADAVGLGRRRGAVHAGEGQVLRRQPRSQSR